MKPVILAVLLLLVVTSFVSGAPTESGKSQYEDEKCHAVTSQTLTS
jgi:hypothetical protein